MDIDIAQIVALVQGHAWVPLASLVIGLLVRLMKSDSAVAWFPIVIPANVRPWVALGLGIVSGVLDKIASGSTWTTALIGGLVAAIVAISGHDLVIESLRGGREIGERKPSGGNGSAPGSASGGKSASLKPGAPAGPYSAKLSSGVAIGVNGNPHILPLYARSEKLVKGPWSRAWFGGMAIVAFCLMTVSGCISQIPQWIQQAIVVEQNIAAIISALHSAADFVFAVSPPSETVRKSVAAAFQDVSLAEAAISELLAAGDATTQEQLDSAYSHLKNAYANLTKLLGELGVVEEAATGTLKVKRGDRVVAMVPLALTVRVVK